MVTEIILKADSFKTKRKMKIKDTFVTQNIKDMQVMVDVSGDDFRGMVRSNKTAAFIVDQLKTETTREEILSTMKQTYPGASEEILAEDLDYVLASLRKIGAIEE